MSDIKETIKLARYWVNEAKFAKGKGFSTSYGLCIENADLAIRVAESELGGEALRKELELDGYKTKKG